VSAEWHITFALWAVCSATAGCCHAWLLLSDWDVALALACAILCCLVVSAQEPASLASHISLDEEEQAWKSGQIRVSNEMHCLRCNSKADGQMQVFDVTLKLDIQTNSAMTALTTRGFSSCFSHTAERCLPMLIISGSIKNKS